MNRAGIDKAIVAPIATKPTQVRSINQWSKAINQQYDDLICFGTIHPGQDDWAQEIDHLVDDHIPGVKMHPDYQMFFVDDPNLTPIYRALADAGLVVLFHAGVDVGLPPPVHCTPDRLAHVLDAVPEMKVIAGHMGGYLCWDDVERYLLGRNLYIDTSFSLHDLGTNRMVELIRVHGVDRVLFGTDSPWTDQSVEVASIRALPLTSDEINVIMGGNAMRILRGYISSL
jgi:predicted TIM-barrel fold metal-dependent hydrolase